MVASEIAAGMLGKLVSAAIARSGPLLFQKINRLRKIDFAITTGKSTPAVVTAALKDFETVIGSYRGELTQPLGDFLDEFERTGLATTMAEVALVNADDASLRNAFTDLYGRMLPSTRDKCDELYSSLLTTFHISFDQRFKDPAGAMLLKACSKQISKNLDKIKSGEAGSSGITTDHAAIDQVIRKLARALNSQFKEIRVETNKGAKWIDIARIYIPSQLVQRNVPKALGETFVKLASRATNTG